MVSYNVRLMFPRCVRVAAHVSTSFLFVAEECSMTLAVPHFVHPLSRWWVLACFHLLAVVSHAVRNICVQVFGWTYLFSSLGTFLGVELLGHVVTLVYIVEKLPDCSLKQLYNFTFPPAMYKHSNFSTSSPTLNYFPFWKNYSHF